MFLSLVHSPTPYSLLCQDHYIFQLWRESDEGTDAFYTNFYALLYSGFTCVLDSVFFVAQVTTYIPSPYAAIAVLYYTCIPHTFNLKLLHNMHYS